MIIQALNALGIQSDFLVDADVKTEEHYLRTYKDLTDSNRFIEWSVLKEKMDELEADYKAKQYQRDRSSEYPTWQEQMDMQYWDAVNGTTTWADAIAAVKAAHPKP